MSDRIANYGCTHVLKQFPTFAAEWGPVSILEIEGLGGGEVTTPGLHLPSLKGSDTIAQDPIVVIDESHKRLLVFVIQCCLAADAE